jgi:hypothetical protein
MQDDALAVGFGNGSGEVYENVITRCQTALSFASEQQIARGPYRIYRNLFDLRDPIASIRPRPLGDLDGQVDSFRFGQFYKGSNNADDGPIDLFQNTCLVRLQQGRASFQLYAHSTPVGPRRSFNNIFVDIDPLPEFEVRATSYLPTFEPGAWPSDGNCYFRVGSFFDQDNPGRTGVVRHESYDFDGQNFPRNEYASLAEFRAEAPDGMDMPPLTYYGQSKTLYAPGYENDSIDVDPKFLVFDLGGDPTADDDFRLSENSPARKAGVILDGPQIIPPILDPHAPSSGRPDMGCYPADNKLLRVGVEGRLPFPANG